MKALVQALVVAAVTVGLMALPAQAQERGPFAAHPGLQITTAFANAYGPDAESVIRFVGVTSQGVNLGYSSSRGVLADRMVAAGDSQNARLLVLGFSPKMPKMIAGSTSLGISTAALDELRATGQTSLALVYDTSLATIAGSLRLQQKDFRFDVLVEDQVVSFPAIRATGAFRTGNRQGLGEFFILDDRNNPVLLQYAVQFGWENQPRSERIILVQAGNSQQAAMQQTLKTIRKLDIYGILFAFDKATIRSEAASVIADIAKTLEVNPTWMLLIKGHTDSIGGEAYNLKLSQARAEAVKAYLVGKHGIDPARLATQGLGMSEPKASNATLQGRKLNRRVELVRTDR